MLCWENPNHEKKNGLQYANVVGVDKLGTLRCYNRDGNENVKKAIVLSGKTTTCSSNTSFYIFLCRHYYDKNA